MMRMLFTAGMLLAATAAFARLASDYIRTEDGALVRAGDAKTRVLDKLGFPDMRLGGSFYYRIDGTIYQIEFDGDTVRWIRRSRD